MRIVGGLLVILAVAIVLFVGSRIPAAEPTTTQAVHETTTYGIDVQTYTLPTSQQAERISERWTLPIGGDLWVMWHVRVTEDGTAFEYVNQRHRLDLDHDGDVDGDDVWIAVCLFDQLGAASHTPGDLDQDGDCDLADYALFVRAMTGPRNGICGEVLRCVKGMRD